MIEGGIRWLIDLDGGNKPSPVLRSPIDAPEQTQGQSKKRYQIEWFSAV
jgi:hypothetical protein